MEHAYAPMLPFRTIKKTYAPKNLCRRCSHRYTEINPIIAISKSPAQRRQHEAIWDHIEPVPHSDWLHHVLLPHESPTLAGSKWNAYQPPAMLGQGRSNPVLYHQSRRTDCSV